MAADQVSFSLSLVKSTRLSSPDRLRLDGLVLSMIIGNA
jgi:hypothetical protein